MNILKLLTKEIKDFYTQENFQRLNDHFRSNTNLLGFAHLELTITKLGDNQTFPHGLRFLPKDVLVTSLIGEGLIQFNYSEFTATNLDLSVLGSGDVSKENPTVIRLYVGTHVEGFL